MADSRIDCRAGVPLRGVDTRRPGAWPFMAGLLATPLLLAGLGWASPRTLGDGFVRPYLWEPLVEDTGYNAYNTLLLLWVAALFIGWFWKLLARFQERIDVAILIAFLPLVLWGSELRVLQDSGYFAPFTGSAVACDPGTVGSIVDRCFGLAFVTPIIYVWIVALFVGLGRLGVVVQELNRHLGVAPAVRFHALSLLAMLSLYAAWWRSGGTGVQTLPSPLWVLLGGVLSVAALVGWIRRRGDVSWRFITFLHGSLLFAITTVPVLEFATGGAGAWRPVAPQHPWVLAAFLLAAILLAGGLWWIGRTSRSAALPQGALEVSTVIYMALLLVAAVLTSVLAIQGLAEGEGPGWAGVGALLLGPLAALACGPFLRRLLGKGSGAFLAEPANLLLVTAQALDAMMTSIGIDVYHAGEKHMLTRGLIEWVSGWGLPGVLGVFPAAVALVPYKVGIAVLLAWVLDGPLRAASETGRHVQMLLKVTIIIVGLAPAARDALRTALGV